MDTLDTHMTTFLFSLGSFVFGAFISAFLTRWHHGKMHRELASMYKRSSESNRDSYLSLQKQLMKSYGRSCDDN